MRLGTPKCVKFSENLHLASEHWSAESSNPQLGAATMRCVMKLASSNQPLEYFILEMDGHARSTHRRFVDALKAGLQLKYEFPNHEIEVRGVAEGAPALDETQATAVH